MFSASVTGVLTRVLIWPPVMNASDFDAPVEDIDIQWVVDNTNRSGKLLWKSGESQGTYFKKRGLLLGHSICDQQLNFKYMHR